MTSATILEELPPVFSTQTYQQAAGVCPSSASRRLRSLSDRGLVSKLRRATWSNLTVDLPSSRSLMVDSERLLIGMWRSGWEVELEAVYGDCPRRICGLTALGMSRVPLVSGFEISVAHAKAVDTSAFGFISRRETAHTVTLDAEQITEHTWVSSPARAVLECAQHAQRYPRYDEHIGRMIVNAFDVCSPDEVQEVAMNLRWRAGRRRLASIAHGLSESDFGQEAGFMADPGWAQLAPKANRGDTTIYLGPFPGHGTNPVGGWVDTDRRVVWSRTPEALAETIST